MGREEGVFASQAEFCPCCKFCMSAQKGDPTPKGTKLKPVPNLFFVFCSHTAEIEVSQRSPVPPPNGHYTWKKVLKNTVVFGHLVGVSEERSRPLERCNGALSVS